MGACVAATRETPCLGQGTVDFKSPVAESMTRRLSSSSEAAKRSGAVRWKQRELMREGGSDCFRGGNGGCGVRLFGWRVREEVRGDGGGERKKKKRKG